MKKIIIGIVIVGLAAVLGYEIENFYPHTAPSQLPPVNVSTTTSPNQNTTTSTDTTVTTNNSPTPSPTPLPDKPIAVAWTTPQPIAKLGLFQNKSDESFLGEASAKYYSVGKVIAGPYAGGTVITAVNPSETIEDDAEYKFIQLNSTYTLIAKNSEGVYPDDLLNHSKFSIDKAGVFPELLFPDTITYNNMIFNLESSNIDPILFNAQNLGVAFTHPKYGPAYTDITPNTANDIKLNGFYFKASDGTVRQYSLAFNFFDSNTNMPNVTWSDGTKNTSEYSDTDRGGCGSTNYASVTYGVSLSGLVPAGKTSFGDTVYELKDTSSPILKNIYNNDYNPYNQPKISYTAFVNSHPAFFWYDGFNRLIKFEKSDFLPQAECGKPVIYLYPQKTENVSVKINPQGGLTKSEPAYDGGWNVMATPESQLTDLKTGNQYPYLFWEGRGGLYETPKKGFVVAASTVHSFLIEKLTLLGLNSQEQKDFLDFWEPRMTGAPYFFVTFLGTEEMNRLAPLTVSPQPDTVIRILMDFTPLQKPISVEGYNIQTPKRIGFTVVEWGGVLR